MSNSSASSIGDQSGGGGGTSGHTASTVVAQPLSGSHVFEIDGYSRTKGFGPGRPITSGTFAVGGHRWCLKYYPFGIKFPDLRLGYRSIYNVLLCLRHSDGANKVKAQYKISLLDQDGQPPKVMAEQTSTFLSNEDQHVSVIEKDFNDSFRVRCDVTAIKDVVRQDIPRCVVVPPSDMHRHLGLLLSDGFGADVTFEVAGETLRAHRNILAARSSVFMAELFGRMKKTNPVRIDDMEAKAFKAMLHFIYTESLPEMDEGEKIVMSQHLLVAADRYNLERLKLICEDKLCRHMVTSTVATTLALAEQHGCRVLKEACFDFLKSPGSMNAVMASDGFEHLKSSCPSILEELLGKLAP